MDPSTYADIELKIIWQSSQATHTERHFFQGINFWRDFFPGMLGDKLMNAADGEWVTETMPANDIVPMHYPSNIVTLSISKIQPIGPGKIIITPQQGRFYPRRIIAGHAGVTGEEFLPLRVLGVEGDQFTIDLNHPLAKNRIEVSLRVVGERYPGKEERGGRCNDVVYEALMGGIGIQTPLDSGTDFYAEGAHDRIDDTDDAIHYKDANLEDTFDTSSGAQLTDLYGRLLQPGDHVLDMMCGAHSYLPDNINGLHVTGIGLNQEELTANRQLTDFVVHNVNKTPVLPFEDNTFNTIVFTAAVEYLTDPALTFRELHRITKPGGSIIVTFTDHWNTLKGILIWSELHPFERLGLTLDYFLKTEGITALHTETIQGLLRPEDDKYANKKLYADPIFAVYGTVT
ncbi:MAG: methyltransferase domain-containing protein [Gammaproteobacteria bacterium]|nr:methyltransferase domain-containing protein [Gammaproteobacteria bacterium]